jgi:signal transduction histidine kinase
VLLGRFTVRGKLALLVLIPLIAIIALTLGAGVQLVQKATRAADTATAVQDTATTAALARALQQERLVSVGYLRGEVDKGTLEQRQAEAVDRFTDLMNARRARLAPAAVQMLDSFVANLGKVRAGVLVHAVGPAQVMGLFNPVIVYLIDSLNLFTAVDGNTAQGREVIALDSLLRVDEGFDALWAAMASVDTAAQLVPYLPAVAVVTQAATRLTNYATPEQSAFFRTAAAAIDGRLGTGATLALVSTPATVLTLKTLPSFAELQSLNGLGRYFESKIIGDVTAVAAASVRSELTQALGFLALALITIIGAVLLGAAVVRSVTGPLGRLTASANRVARLAESELVRVADADVMTAAPVRLVAVEVVGRDEIADLARAFERVQETAARLVERQVVSRRNVALMFGHVGRRTQNLVGRQIALIDRISDRETEPDQLHDIARLDQVASRLRRSASSLVVLSGAAGADERTAPMPLRDLIGLGLAEIEDVTRVDVEVANPVQVAPALINDLILLLAELMDNAVSFSPPTTRVLVSARITGVGARVEVVDHGLGLSSERLAEENARLAARERLDLAPTEVLGLFVVGRLARRHGMGVSLSPTRGGGITAVVDLPASILTSLRSYQETAQGYLDRAAGPPGEDPAGADLGRPSRTARGLVLARVGSPPSASTVSGHDGLSAILADPDPDLFDVAALDRASQSISDGQHWNAFSAQTAIAATPAPVPDQELDEVAGTQPAAGPGPGSWAAPAITGPALTGQPSPAEWNEPAAHPLRADWTEPPGWGEGSPRPGWSTDIAAPHWSDPAPPVTAPTPRVPPPVSAPASVPAPMPAAGPVPAPAVTSWPVSAPPQWPTPAPGSVPAHRSPSDPTLDIPPVIPGRPERRSAWTESVPQPFQLPTVPAAPAAGLNRRVPGATLDALEATGPGGRAHPALNTPTQLNPRVQDAEQVRESFAQFESGVARAMREVDRPDEGSP